MNFRLIMEQAVVNGFLENSPVSQPPDATGEAGSVESIPVQREI